MHTSSVVRVVCYFRICLAALCNGASGLSMYTHSFLPQRSSGSRSPTLRQATEKGARWQCAGLCKLLPWPQGTFDVKRGDHPQSHQLPFSTRPVDDVRDIRGPDRPPVGWSRL